MTPGRILIILFCINCTACFSQVNKSLVDNWKSYPIPTNIDSLRNYNSSLNEWVVFIKNKNVGAAKIDPEKKPVLPFKIDSVGRARLSVLNVDDGYLIGFNAGEWGGHLSWYSKDGKVNYKISNDEIISFIKRKGKIYAIQGLDHMGISGGSIIEIEKTNDKWMSQQYLELPEAPYAIASDPNNNFTVITSHNLLKIDSNKKVRMPVANGIWKSGLYPSSLIINKNIVYAGMRGGVFKYNLLTGKQEWLMPY